MIDAFNVWANHCCNCPGTMSRLNMISWKDMAANKIMKLCLLNYWLDSLISSLTSVGNWFWNLRPQAWLQNTWHSHLKHAPPCLHLLDCSRPTFVITWSGIHAPHQFEITHVQNKQCKKACFHVMMTVIADQPTHDINESRITSH